MELTLEVPDSARLNERVCPRGGLAGSIRRVVGESNAEPTAFAGIERTYATSHAVRYHPDRDGVGIDNCTIDALSRRVYVLA
jgi:hypothetical protein